MYELVTLSNHPILVRASLLQAQRWAKWESADNISLLDCSCSPLNNDANGDYPWRLESWSLSTKASEHEKWVARQSSRSWMIGWTLVKGPCSLSMSFTRTVTSQVPYGGGKWLSLLITRMHLWLLFLVQTNPKLIQPLKRCAMQCSGLGHVAHTHTLSMDSVCTFVASIHPIPCIHSHALLFHSILHNIHFVHGYLVS